MCRKFFCLVLGILLLASCNRYNYVMKTTDIDYKYEEAKEYFISGSYGKAATLLEGMIMSLKGSMDAEESLYMLAMCQYHLGDYQSTFSYLSNYYKTYPKGTYAELAHYYSGKALYMQSPDPRLDQSPTYNAIKELQTMIDLYPYSDRRDEVNDMIFQLQNRLVQKEYGAAKLYYNLGSYTGNCPNGGTNYEACVITAENALKSYPYTSYRERLYILIIKSKYELARNSVPEKEMERYRETIDEIYGFKNEFPESDFIKEADHLLKEANRKVTKNGQSDLSSNE